jgi:hypothetical protein
MTDFDLYTHLQQGFYSPWVGYWNDIDGNDMADFLDTVENSRIIVLDCVNSRNLSPDITHQQMLEIGICIGRQKTVVVLVSNEDVLEDMPVGNPGDCWYGATVVTSPKDVLHILHTEYIGYEYGDTEF